MFSIRTEWSRVATERDLSKKNADYVLENGLRKVGDTSHVTASGYCCSATTINPAFY